MNEKSTKVLTSDTIYQHLQTQHLVRHRSKVWGQ